MGSQTTAMFSCVPLAKRVNHWIEWSGSGILLDVASAVLSLLTVMTYMVRQTAAACRQTHAQQSRPPAHHTCLAACRSRHTTLSTTQSGCRCASWTKSAAWSLLQSGAFGAGCHATGWRKFHPCGTCRVVAAALLMLSGDQELPLLPAPLVEPVSNMLGVQSASEMALQVLQVLTCWCAVCCTDTYAPGSPWWTSQPSCPSSSPCLSADG